MSARNVMNTKLVLLGNTSVGTSLIVTRALDNLSSVLLMLCFAMLQASRV